MDAKLHELLVEIIRLESELLEAEAVVREAEDERDKLGYSLDVAHSQAAKLMTPGVEVSEGYYTFALATDDSERLIRVL